MTNRILHVELTDRSVIPTEAEVQVLVYPELLDAETQAFLLGAQLDLSFTVLHWYDMVLSLGYASGYRGSRRAGDEWMVSLKIM